MLHVVTGATRVEARPLLAALCYGEPLGPLAGSHGRWVMGSYPLGKPEPGHHSRTLRGLL